MYNVMVTKGVFWVSLSLKSKQPARECMAYFINWDIDSALTKMEAYFLFTEKFDLILWLCSVNSSETQILPLLLLLSH